MTNSSATPHFDLTPPSEAQLRKLIDGLSDEERRVMLHHGDEEPFCGVFLAEKREGVFTCRLSGLPLSKAGTKFESGTGWPSFTAPFDEDHLRRVPDARYATETFEVVCARCGAQQGHVFDRRGRDTSPVSRCGHGIAELRMVSRTVTQLYDDVLRHRDPQGQRQSAGRPRLRRSRHAVGYARRPDREGLRQISAIVVDRRVPTGEPLRRPSS